MPYWMLKCIDCGSDFAHSEIKDTSLLDYLMPLKPDFPPGGSELECTNCGCKATYQRENLTYQAQPARHLGHPSSSQSEESSL